MFEKSKHAHKNLDEAMAKCEKIMIEQAAERNRLKPYLDAQLRVIQKFDKKIEWFEHKIKEIEKEKEKEINKIQDLLELAGTVKHELDDGYQIKPDNRREIVIKDIKKFMLWLKQNKTSSEVLDFFESALKATAVKRFCEKEHDKQRLNGIMSPAIDGVIMGDMTFRQLKTSYKNNKA